MTIQVPDLIYYEGRRRELYATPLESYFDRGGVRPAMESSYSALWRGYVATWRLEGNRLFLVHLAPGIADSTKLTVGTLFPGQGRRVLATWFTGRLRIGHGRCVAPLHGDGWSARERETLAEVVAGRAVAFRLLDRAISPCEEWLDEVPDADWR